jgi:hypothetical protein
MNLSSPPAEEDPLSSMVPSAFLPDLGILSRSPSPEMRHVHVEETAMPPLLNSLDIHKPQKLDAVFASWGNNPKERRQSNATQRSESSGASTYLSNDADVGVSNLPGHG